MGRHRASAGGSGEGDETRQCVEQILRGRDAHQRAGWLDRLFEVEYGGADLGEHSIAGAVEVRL
jgi:hypothetical protein